MFVAAMAARFIKRSKGTIHSIDATTMAIECLRLAGEEFGTEAMSWDADAAAELADEEISYWDESDAGANA
ncbi:hypothetical protein LGQ03_07350 [Loktanella sp. TSTF-M6]|uniref:Uncharacterized protein n=1 Tax=Loktanella gaetbuli TaxID=2881335 RepID=A0ABS8BTK8_9RHOB|nr:hypothetical protein [Loktanella gaetbuli]MCB5199052.1 hypothetical protein [Loktanella gaetbuli]